MHLNSEVLLEAYELADRLTHSDEAIEYIKCKETIENDPKIKELKVRFRKEKELYDEAQRFGHFHPNYHEAKQKVEETLTEINNNENYTNYKQAEDHLNELLHVISNELAAAVSKSIIVPGNNDLLSGDICTTGNCTSCGLKGSCAI